MFQYIVEELQRAERSSSIVTRSDAFAYLRRLGIDDFGQILLEMPNHQLYPTISALLPAMASVDVQRAWTGDDGRSLLAQTASFVRSVSYNYTRVTGRPLDGRAILDYGCGWGRIARLMYYFSDESNVIGVDPWDRSLAECSKAGLSEACFRLSDYLPVTLPVDDRVFDLIYAFSVFTHLSKRATLAAASVLRKYISDSGVLVITVRPVEYWNLTEHLIGADGVKRQIEAHATTGFAFVGHQREAVDGDVTYGETSMSFDWVRENFVGWRLRSVDRSENDPYQIYLFLEPN